MSAWETRLVETERGVFEVFEKGEGAPICATHLYSEFNETGDRFAAAFTPFGKVYLVNTRSTGRSEPAHEEHQLSMEETARDMEAIRKALGYERWHFAGHSTGGMLGLVYAIRHGASLDSLTVVGAAARRYNDTKACIYHKEHPRYRHMQDLIEQLKSPELSSGERKRLTVERTKLSLCNPDRHDEYFSGPVHKKMAGHRLHYMALHEFQTYNLNEDLPSITVPTLILCGAKDVQCPPHHSEEMHSLIPQSELRLFAESNHYPFLEEPEKFHAVLEAFYRRIEPVSNSKKC